jgi:hypothetical protein
MTDGRKDEREGPQLNATVNQSIFREVNESLQRLNHDFSEIISTGEFVCECADAACTSRIGLTIAEYERLRSVPTHFAVRHGHVSPDAERIVEERNGYTVVEKTGAAGDYARRVDPRAPATA